MLHFDEFFMHYFGIKKKKNAQKNRESVAVDKKKFLRNI
jgi:hypothetical protein